MRRADKRAYTEELTSQVERFKKTARNGVQDNELLDSGKYVGATDLAIMDKQRTRKTSSNRNRTNSLMHRTFQ